MTEFGKTLKKICIDLEISQAEMARSIGYSNTFLGAMIQGKKKINEEALGKIIDFLEKRGVTRTEELSRLADMSNGFVDISKLSVEQQHLVARLARESLDEAQALRLEAALRTCRNPLR